MRLRPGIGLPCATGLYFAPREIVLAQITLGPRGWRLTSTTRHAVDEGNLGAVLAELKAAGKLRGRVACGIDPRRLYAVTRRTAAEGPKVPPGTMLASALGLGEDSVLAAGAPVRLSSGPHLALVGCRREQIEILYRELCAIGLAAARMLPVHWALAQNARKIGPRPRRWKADVRVLPGGHSSLAILSWQGFPVACRPLDMLGRDPAHAVELAVLSLLTHAREELGLSGVDGVVLHMGDAAGDLPAECEKALGLPQRVGPRVELDEERAAEALARLALVGRHAAIDMFEALRPPAGWKQNLPLRTAATLLVALGATGWALASEAAGLESSAERLLAQAEANCRKARAPIKDLAKLHEKLGSEVGIAHAFIADRVWISDIFTHLSEVVPTTMTVVDLDVKDYVSYPSKKTSVSKVARRVVNLAGEVPLGEASSSPPEVAEMKDLLDGSPYFQANFPRVTGANVRLLPAVKGLSARISVSYLPPATGG